MIKTDLDDWKVLKELSLLNCLSDSELEIISKNISVLTFKSDETVCKEDSLASSMYFIGSGKVQVSKKSVSLAQLDEGDYFGEMSLLKKCNRTATVKTIGTSVIYELNSDQFYKFLKISPAVMEQIADTFEVRLKGDNKIIVAQYLELQEKYKELKNATNKLVESEKIAALGLLGANIAHEIKNPITIIQGNCQILQDTLAKEKIGSEKMTNCSSKIMDMTKRMAQLIKSLQNLAKNSGKCEFKPVYLKDVFQDLLVLSSNKLKMEGVRLEEPVIADDLTIDCNRVELSQVLVNLINNAIYATLQTQDRWIKIGVEESSDMLEISVTDSGSGIETDVANNMFDSLFTTKPNDMGVGLGLSTCKRIVNQHGGTLSLDTNSSNTKFVMQIPKRQLQMAG